MLCLAAKVILEGVADNRDELGRIDSSALASNGLEIQNVLE